jgi:hypothetical protein
VKPISLRLAYQKWGREYNILLRVVKSKTKLKMTFFQLKVKIKGVDIKFYLIPTHTVVRNILPPQTKTRKVTYA